MCEELLKLPQKMCGNFCKKIRCIDNIRRKRDFINGKETKAQ